MPESPDVARRAGQQQVAKSIRRHGGRHLLWVAGPGKGTTLDEAWAHRLRGVDPLMYAEHRPNGPHTAKNWDRVSATSPRGIWR